LRHTIRGGATSARTRCAGRISASLMCGLFTNRIRVHWPLLERHAYIFYRTGLSSGHFACDGSARLVDRVYSDDLSAVKKLRRTLQPTPGCVFNEDTSIFVGRNQRALLPSPHLASSAVFTSMLPLLKLAQDEHSWSALFPSAGLFIRASTTT